MNLQFLRRKEISSYIKKTGFLFSIGLIALIALSIIFYNYIVGFIFPKGTSGDKNANIETLKFLAYIIGGVLLIWQIVLTNRRTKAAEKTASASLENLRILESGQVQERFKNAIDQLGSNSEAVNLGAIYTLHHIAKYSDELRKSIFDILCSYIRETTSTLEYQDKDNPSIKIQSTLTLLFNDKTESKTYEDYNADLHGAWLNKANLSSANLRNSNLSHAKLNEAILTGADLQNAKLIEAKLKNAYIDNANLKEATLSFADLSWADLRHANLDNAKMNKSDLSESKLKYASLQKVNLYKADLSNSDLSKANLEGAIMTECNLYSANMTGACLYKTNLKMADLSMATLRQANLCETEMSKSTLRRIELDEAYVDNKDWITNLSSWECNEIEDIINHYEVVYEKNKSGETSFVVREKENDKVK